MIEVVHDRSACEFLLKARDHLYRNEAVNSLTISLCNDMQVSFNKSQPLLLRLTQDKMTVGTAIHSGALGLLLSQAPPQAIENLVRHLCLSGTELSGVVGPEVETCMFSDLWSALTGQQVASAFLQSIFRIENVRFPLGVDGEFRLARTEDAPLLSDWTRTFACETFGHYGERKPSYWRSIVEKDILARKTFLWVKSERPVSMACVRRSTRNGSSISSVYTPTEERGRGYASALVAHLSQKILNTGKKFCVLYVDQNNLRACRIYTEIGYEEVARSAHCQFVKSSVAC